MTTAYVSIHNKKKYYKILKCSHNRKKHGCSNTIKEENVKKACDDYINPIYECDKQNIKSLLEVVIKSLLLINNRQKFILSKIDELAEHPKTSYYRNIIKCITVGESLKIEIINNIKLD